MKKKMKRSKIKALSVAGILALTYSMACGPSDSSIKDRVVQITSARGSCSGEQVQAPSGAAYILTAAHCRALADKDGTVMVTREDGSQLKRKVIAEDPTSDLLLVEGLPGVRGLKIARSASPGQEVRTFTHGAAFRTYKTEGVIVQDKEMLALIGVILDETSRAACEAGAPKLKIIDVGFFKACVLSVTETATTAMIVPGSSGGAVVNSHGSLIGVVSAGGDGFGYLVRLSDIQAFLSGY